MLEDLGPLALYMFLGEIAMSEFSNWQGYLVCNQGDDYFISSPWGLNDKAVFGADSDYNTLALSLLQYMLSLGIKIDSLKSEDSIIDMSFLNIASGLEENTSTNQWIIFCSEEAMLGISNSILTNFPKPENLNNVDEIRYNSLSEAWGKESAIENVSQGAYISAQQYSETLVSRINLLAQSGNDHIWPPRELNEQGDYYGSEIIRLSNTCKIESWTKLSAAGAPSEFSIRAPLLGGISTAYVSFNHGTKGVFLLVDDEEISPEIGDKGEIVVRRIYAQEGQMRYGTKVRIID